MSTGNGKDDLMAFGMHKGKKIVDLMRNEPAYLCWLRDETIKKRQAFFDDEVNRALDMWIKATKQRKYRHWASNPPDFLVKVEDEDAVVIPATARPAPIQKPEPAPVLYAASYGDEWGAW